MRTTILAAAAAALLSTSAHAVNWGGVIWDDNTYRGIYTEDTLTGIEAWDGSVSLNYSAIRNLDSQGIIDQYPDTHIATDGSSTNIVVSKTSAISNVIMNPIAAYLADEGINGTFADGVANGYFEDTFQTRVDFMYYTNGGIDTDYEVWNAWLNPRGNKVLSTGFVDDVLNQTITIKYRPISDTFKIEVGSFAAIGDTLTAAIAHAHSRGVLSPSAYRHLDDIAALFPTGADLEAEVRAQLGG